MPLSQANIEPYQGDDWAATVTVYNEDRTLADITTYTAKAQIRLAVADSDPVVAAEMATTVESPYVFLSLTHDQTVLLSGRYVWDLQLLSATGQIITILAGKVQVKAEVTRSVAV